MNLLSYLFEGNNKAAIVCQTELREQDVLLVVSAELCLMERGHALSLWERVRGEGLVGTLYQFFLFIRLCPFAESNEEEQRIDLIVH